ncbi:MAG: hypothetical protein QOJ93_1072, partial [Actinomycetota bacterium]|nr:hypothetical protein [Actinomycetota bacterium]
MVPVSRVGVVPEEEGEEGVGPGLEAGDLAVVIVVRPPAVVPPTPNLVTEATGTVTVTVDSDLGDGIASSGETHHRHHSDKSISSPDLTAAPA